MAATGGTTCAVRKVRYFGPVPPDGQRDRNNCAGLLSVFYLVVGGLQGGHGQATLLMAAVRTLCRNAPTGCAEWLWHLYTHCRLLLLVPPRQEGQGSAIVLGGHFWGHNLFVATNNPKEQRQIGPSGGGGKGRQRKMQGRGLQGLLLPTNNWGRDCLLKEQTTCVSGREIAQ